MSYLQPSKETLRVLETAPNVFLVLSPDLNILTASDLCLDATQSKKEAIVGKHIFEAFPENPVLIDADGVGNITASLQKVLKTKKPHFLAIQRYDMPDIDTPGKFIKRYWDLGHTPVLSEDGSIHYIIESANNITQKVQAEHETANRLANLRVLEMSEKHFRHLADLVPAKISNKLPSGEVTFLNKKWLEYTGMSFEDLRDFGYHAMMHPDEIPLFITNLELARINKVSFETEMRFKDFTGKYRWHLNIVSPILDDNGDITMWVGSTTDIQRLKEEEQQKNDFMSMVSHELKTPLTSLKGYLQIMNINMHKCKDLFTTQAVEQSLKQVNKMTKMITSFLNVARLESSQFTITKTLFDMQQLFDEAEAEVVNMYPTHKIIFSCSSSSSILADYDKIGHVITNLIANAAKYSKEGTEINVSCSSDQSQIEVVISDQGFGIKPQDLKHVFERYYRVDTHYGVSGFGIGLYLCYEIIKLHEGRIWVESEVGIGSDFHFSLPKLLEVNKNKNIVMQEVEELVA